MKKLIMSALTMGMLVLMACGTTAQVTDVEKGVTISADQSLTCKGSAFQGNEWYSKGEVWNEVDFVNLAKPTKVERSGMNYCRNNSGQTVTLTVTDDKSGQTKSFATSETHFYFEVDSNGKIVGIDGVTPVGPGFDIAVTTTSKNELYVKSATLDGKEITINGSTAFSSVSGLTLPSVLPGVVELLVCFNVTDMTTCHNVVLGGKMDPQNSVYLKVKQKSFAPYLIVSYVEVNKEESLVAELMIDGSFASPAKITPIIWDVSTVEPECPGCKPIVDLNVVDGLYGSHAKGLNIVATGAVWIDIGDWGQSQFSLWCRMQVGGNCGYSLASVNDTSRSAGSWEQVLLPGIFGDSPDDRQARRTVTITDGKKYSIKYCIKTAAGGSMYYDVVSTNNTGDQLQVSIYDLLLSANTLYCDSFTFEATATGSFYLAGHIGSISAGDLRFDDFSLTEVP